MDWQSAHFEQVVAALPDAAVELHGSATRVEQLDGWSDLDLRLTTDGGVPLESLTVGSGLWAYEDVRTPTAEICRTVLADGRRVDVSINGAGRIIGLESTQDNEIRFLASMAATKLGRGDRLIGGHLALDLIRSCLVIAMQLRDRDCGTTVHRHGSDRDRYAEQAMRLASLPLAITPRPNVVERTTELYAAWRAELDPEYQPDWSGLSALIDRGLEK
jgi:hypothetical protein